MDGSQEIGWVGGVVVCGGGGGGGLMRKTAIIWKKWHMEGEEN